MTDVADRFVVVLDTNVLYPFIVRDALLRLAEKGLYRARWSDEIIEEWQKSLLRDKPDLSESIESQIAVMKQIFAEAWVVGYEDLIQGLKLPDEDDRHVLAVAIRSGAQLIVTENLKDFPDKELDKYDIEAVTADVFIANTFELYPKECMLAFRDMRTEYTNPSMDPARFIIALMKAGLGLTAAQVKERLDFL